jgi:hypothetical protein
MLAAGSLLWLLYELKMQTVAAVVATSLAMWNPYRGEVWLGLGLTEAFAMPYALMGLFCALRAARSPRPWGWDLAGMLCLLAALGIKNTFAAMVPAQVLLRLIGGGLGLRDGLRENGWRASLHATLLVLPVIHFVAFRLTSSPTRYATEFTWAQFPRLLRSLVGAMSLDVMAPGFVAAGLAISFARRRGYTTRNTIQNRFTYRLSLLTGLVLLVCGTAIYLPISGVAGRYTMPAIWGADICFAALLSTLLTVPLLLWRRLAIGLIAVGLVAVAVMNVGRQEKVAARNALLWDALEYVEQESPRYASLGWVGTPEVATSTLELPFSEGFHFGAHLRGRGRADVEVQLISRQVDCAEKIEPALILTGTPVPPAGGYVLVREFKSTYWVGKRCFQCYLWKQGEKGNS